MLRQRGRHLTEGGKKLLKKITTQRIFLRLPSGGEGGTYCCANWASHERSAVQLTSPEKRHKSISVN